MKYLIGYHNEMKHKEKQINVWTVKTGTFIPPKNAYTHK